MAAATAFGLVVATPRLFHTLRVLAYVWLIASVTVVYLALRIAGDLNLALAGFIVVVSLVLFSAFLSTVVELAGTDDPRPVEPLTSC